MQKCLQIVLEKVIGLTATRNAALAVNHVTGELAYPAGALVVIYDPVSNKQRVLHGREKRVITTLAFSADGKRLCGGEVGAV